MKRHRLIIAAWIVLGLSALAAPPAAAQPATTLPTAGALGERFQSLASGVAMHPPAGAKIVRGAMGTPEIANFLVEDKNWVIKLTRVLLDEGKPLPLSTWKDKQGVDRAGMLEWVVEQFKTDRPGATILRQETTLINGQQVGLLAAKFSFGVETNLFQQAVIRASDMQYYVLSMTCPAPKGDLANDSAAQLASEVFSRMLETIELLDQSSIREDQDERLLHTRTLFVNIKTDPEKIKRVMQKEQWLRYIRNGTDFGYSKVLEEVARDLPRKGQVQPQTGPEGVLVGVRSQMRPDAGFQNDGESWLFCSFDGKYEAFYNIAYIQDPKGKSTGGEIGTSRWSERPVADRGTPEIGQQKGIRLTEDYRLEVTKLGLNVSNEPIVRGLPPYYLPQAFGQLLSRIVALRGLNTYLFAIWASDAGQVMYRYVDVEAERDVVLGARRVRAIPVKDHVGLEGSITIHYVSPDGHYLGSVNDDSKITILSSDQASIERIWSNPNLSRPAPAN